MTQLIQSILANMSQFGLDTTQTSLNRFYAGFVPDFSAIAGFDNLPITSDLFYAPSPLHTERTIMLEQGDQRVRVKLFIGTYGAGDARLALATDFLNFMRQINAVPDDPIGPTLGDFTLIEFNGQEYSLIAFGKNNVVVSLINDGIDSVDLRTLAEGLFDQLLASPEYDEDGIASLRPQITAHYLATQRIDPHSTVPLILLAKCPQGYPISYQFETTHGAINWVSNDPPRFFYQSGTTVGFHILTSYVMSNSGLTSISRLDFSVGAGNLGYSPGFKPEMGLVVPN